MLNAITAPDLVRLTLLRNIGNILYFAEVKTRRSRAGLHPSLSVTAKKIEKLRMLGEHYLSQMHLMHLQPRFDVIAVQLAGKTPPDIDHFVNAF